MQRVAMADDIEDYVGDWEEQPYFRSAYCTCEHESEEHSWDGCKVEGCKCEANWEE